MEIEDVLSSIRRLVSEDARPPVRPKPAAPDKLVLTPALRIVPEPEPGPAPDAPAAEAPPPPMPAEEGTAAFDPLSHRAAAAALEAALSQRPDDWEPDGSEITAQGAEIWTVEWEAEGSTPAAPTPTPAFVSSRSPAPAPAMDPPPAPPEADSHAMDWADAPAASASALPLDDDLPSVDEETLRDLIRDILREELQGPLGERITRNVRKLVRAEIARALATRDFD